jgi:hypothetical protein
VELEPKNGGAAKPVRVKVGNVRPSTLGHWHHGCALVNKLTDAELNAIL